MQGVEFHNAAIRIKSEGTSAIRTIEPLPNTKVSSMTIGGSLEMKSYNSHHLDQLTITEKTKKGPKEIRLFESNHEQGVSFTREFHLAFRDSKSLKDESVYFNAIDPVSEKRIRMCVRSKGFYLACTTKDGAPAIIPSEKKSYKEMDLICQATMKYAKKQNIDFYIYSNKDQKNNADNQVDFTNINNEGDPQSSLSTDGSRGTSNSKYLEKKNHTTICTIL